MNFPHKEKQLLMYSRVYYWEIGLASKK
jgi:hypothetical protein